MCLTKHNLFSFHSRFQNELFLCDTFGGNKRNNVFFHAVWQLQNRLEYASVIFPCLKTWMCVHRHTSAVSRSDQAHHAPVYILSMIHYVKVKLDSQLSHS